MKKLLIICMLPLFFGCVSLTVETPDGMKINYASYGDRQIDGLSFKKTKTGFVASMNKITTTEQDITIPEVGEIK